MQGVVARIISEKGFGFIKASGSGKEFFFHRSTVTSPGGYNGLHEGDLVTFEPAQGLKGPRAEDVRQA